MSVFGGIPPHGVFGAGLPGGGFTGNLQGQVWGTPIGISAGVRKIVGLPLWRGTRETASVFSASETTGYPNNTVVTKSEIVKLIRQDCAYVLGRKLISTSTPKVRRIWINGNLAYSNGVGQPYIWNNLYKGYDAFTALVNGTTTLDATIKEQLQNNTAIDFDFYDGSETQLPHPLVKEKEGDLAPAFRGLMYIVFKKLVVGSLLDYGNDVTDGSSLDTNHPPYPMPSIQVELVDGSDATSTAKDFTFDPSGPGFFYSNNIVVTNWPARQVAIVDPSATSPYIHVYDADNHVEVYARAMTGLSGGSFGNQLSTMWDIENNVFYASCTVGSTGYALGSVNATTGALISATVESRSNLGPFDAGNNNPYSTGLDAVAFSKLDVADLGHYVEAGAKFPVIFGQGNFEHSAVVVCPEKNGTLPASYPRDSFFQHPTLWGSCIALPCDKKSYINGFEYQDSAFIVTAANVATLYFIRCSSVGGRRVGRVIGSQVLYTHVDSGRSLVAQLDSTGSIILWSNKTAANTFITRLAVTYETTPDYTNAPGWQGMFPKVNLTPVYENVDLGFTDALDRRSLWSANTAQDTMLLGTHIVSLLDGTSTSHTEFSTAHSDSDAWDSSTTQLLWHRFNGSLGGNSLAYQYASAGLNLGGISKLSDVLSALALAGGYTVGQISVDSGLTDDVLGVLITQPYDLNTLFNDMSVIYDFSYYESAGTVKFERSSRNPQAASVTWSIGGNVSDGATATLGTATYTFKNTLSAPFHVKIGATAADTLNNFLAAIDLSGTFGTEYATGTTQNAKVYARKVDASHLLITAFSGGVAGNTIASTSTGSNHSFTSTTLTGGSAPPAPDYTLTVDDMAPISEGSAMGNEVLLTTIETPTAAMEAATINYYSIDQDYAVAAQTFNPDNRSGAELKGNLVQQYSLPIIMSNTEAYNRITKTSLRAGEMQITQEFRLPQKFLPIEPTDIVQITIAPFQYQIRCDEVTINGDYTLSISGFNYVFRDDVAINDQSNLGQLPQILPGTGDARPLVIDGPILDPNEGSTAGVFKIRNGVLTMGQPFWTQAQLVSGAATDSSLALQYNATDDVKWGYCQTLLPDTLTPFMVDEVTQIKLVGVSASANDFASCTDLEMLAGTNVIAVGADGRWEYIYFRDVSASGNLITLSGLVRGMRGTDAFTDQHIAGDRFVLLRSKAAGFAQGDRVQSFESAKVGLQWRWQAIGTPLSRKIETVQDSLLGYSLFPFTVADIHVTASAGNLIITWQRRDRLGNEWVTFPQILSETTEVYDLEIMSGTSVVRTVAGLTSPTYTYTAAQQATDGFSSPTTLKVRIYQKGELGRGFTKARTVNVE